MPPVAERLRRAYPGPAWVRSPPTPTHKMSLLSAVGDFVMKLCPFFFPDEDVLLDCTCSWTNGFYRNIMSAFLCQVQESADNSAVTFFELTHAYPLHASEKGNRETSGWESAIESWSLCLRGTGWAGRWAKEEQLCTRVHQSPLPRSPDSALAIPRHPRIPPP
jgi:hypothetical protein